jgi:nitroreductase
MNANAIAFQDRPASFPTKQVGGAAMKSITQLLLDRRATQHFQKDPVPQEYLEAILRLGAQAPSGYNLQPWRFIVVREEENRKRLRKAAMNQAKVAEAPVVIIAFAIEGEWRQYIDRVFEEGARRGMGEPEQMVEVKKAAAGFLDTMPSALWLNRHTMIAVTTMMLVAEAYGLDTAPMEGFDPQAVKREFALPEEAEVIALLAIGRAKLPDKPYAGRLALENLVFAERYGQPWPGGKGT